MKTLSECVFCTGRGRVGVGAGENEGQLIAAKDANTQSTWTREMMDHVSKLADAWNEATFEYEVMHKFREDTNQDRIGNGWTQEKEDVYLGIEDAVNKVFGYMFEVQNKARSAGEYVSKQGSDLGIFGAENETQIVPLEDGGIAYKNGDNLRRIVASPKDVGVGGWPALIAGAAATQPWIIVVAVIAGAVVIVVFTVGVVYALVNYADVVKAECSRQQNLDRQEFFKWQVEHGIDPGVAQENVNKNSQNAVNEIRANTDLEKASNKFGDTVTSVMYGLLGITVVGGIIYGMATFGGALAEKRAASKIRVREVESGDEPAALPAHANPSRRRRARSA